ncbi:MAG: hypothetical protein HY063_14745 [Bacteroidetes bacterium]|nr:hypothetical protein [Bacteroidota bacterium]
MEICIIDKTNGRTHIKENLRLLWASVLVNEHTSVSSCHAEFISFTLALKDWDEGSKFALYADWVKDNPKWTKEQLDAFHENYSLLVKTRKLKGKSKDTILLTFVPMTIGIFLFCSFAQSAIATPQSAISKTDSLLSLVKKDKEDTNNFTR